jgi:hypothetical protein
MAAELATGALVMYQIKSGISMLVAKKVILQKQLITFTCKDGHLIEQAIQQTATGEGKPLMKSIGG